MMAEMSWIVVMGGRGVNGIKCIIAQNGGGRHCGLYDWQRPWYHAGKQMGEHHMAEITIVQQHKLAPKKAREAAQKVAERMAEEYDMEWEWEGDVLLLRTQRGAGFADPGKDKKAEMYIKLGFLMRAFASTIEAKVAENMKKVFA
jgi:putative polyhydroxyalkanoate system protein